MLFDINSRKIKEIPHKKEFDSWKKRLSQEEIDAINEEIRKNVSGQEVKVAAWISGKNWENSPYFPIFEKACLSNRDIAGKCFGLFVWAFMMDDDEEWFFTKQETSTEGYNSMIYFKRNG